MRSSRVVRVSGCQCQSRNSTGFDPMHPPIQWNLKNPAKKMVDNIRASDQL
jgi:hypothetical protein